ncbi:hypothetical protein KC19_VG145500 [Ceratodon purpureus]|uniref:Uncharacterized protein n=1 Tax=Ceratodon purpureus TaxID=3225 RepID=A0A8T0HQ78_CERPU|nr:hypothetical protein KC19_VG145500 [Ceratodon purpureus]
MPKRSRRDKPAADEEKRETVEAVKACIKRTESSRSDVRRKGRKRSNTEDGAAEVREERLKGVPGDSPHRPLKLVSSIQTTVEATTTRSRAHTNSEAAMQAPRERKKSKALGEQFEAATENDSNQLNLEINSMNHKIRLVITSPAKKKKSQKKVSEGEADNDGDEMLGDQPRHSARNSSSSEGPLRNVHSPSSNRGREKSGRVSRMGSGRAKSRASRRTTSHPGNTVLLANQNLENMDTHNEDNGMTLGAGLIFHKVLTRPCPKTLN